LPQRRKERKEIQRNSKKRKMNTGNLFFAPFAPLRQVYTFGLGGSDATI
jgi:hypothetical protein